MYKEGLENKMGLRLYCSQRERQTFNSAHGRFSTRQFAVELVACFPREISGFSRYLHILHNRKKLIFAAFLLHFISPLHYSSCRSLWTGHR